jgi:hypothetical protein
VEEEKIMKTSDIETILIEAQEEGQGVYRCGTLGHPNAGRKIVNSLKDIDTPLRCSRPRCFGGGYDFRSIIHNMAHAGETEKEGSISCEGHEASPKGKRKYKMCLNTLRYKATLTYRQDTDSAASDSTSLSPSVRSALLKFHPE